MGTKEGAAVLRVGTNSEPVNLNWDAAVLCEVVAVSFTGEDEMDLLLEASVLVFLSESETEF